MSAINDTLQQHLLLLAVGVCFLIVTQMLAIRYHFYRYPSKSDSVPLNFFRAMIGAFVLFFAIELLLFPSIAIFWLYLTGNQTIESYALGWLNLSAILTLAIALGGYLFMSSSQVRETLFGSQAFVPQIFKDFAFGALSFVVSYPVVLVIGQVMAILVLAIFQMPRLDQVAVQHLKMFAVYPSLYWTTVICFVTVVPFVEEVLFRGFLQTALKEFFGMKGALVTASLIFAVFHFSVSQGVNNIELLPALFVLSCYLGFIYERQRSLFAPIGLHVVFNIIGVILTHFGEHL